ncbi:PREDICTED: uncharacterized protein LOC109192481 [Ipomoea nil]|uniref:uncharacterized protein LOC109192481 n=1 Tax=Ipomoea nil TaxID=35883 RepID=UPI000901A87C|nr:PREDICTED: uncharacterized protein LOC109192481 [Ipomoea nil]
MFNDDEPLSFKKMHEFSTTDGFVEIADNLADMVKFVANEPCVGLFYVQQHVRNAVPNLVNLKSKVAEKSHGTTLHAEDLEDSIAMARSMKDCGFPIAEGMIKDIRHSLTVLSARDGNGNGKKGLINMRSSSFRVGRGSTSWGRSSPKPDVERGGYLSNVFRSVREKPSSIKWPQLEPREKAGEPSFTFRAHTPSALDASSSSTVADADSDDLPVSSQIGEDGHEVRVDRSLFRDHRILSSSKSYEELNSEARLEHWLEGTSNPSAD